MDKKAQRKQHTAEYKRTHTEAGVYRMVNTQTGRALLGSSVNLESVRNKLKFAQTTRSASALDYRLAADVRRIGPDAFTFEVLEVLETRPEMTPAEIASELATLEALWREKLDSALLY